MITVFLSGISQEPSLGLLLSPLYQWPRLWPWLDSQSYLQLLCPNTFRKTGKGIQRPVGFEPSNLLQTPPETFKWEVDVCTYFICETVHWDVSYHNYLGVKQRANLGLKETLWWTTTKDYKVLGILSPNLPSCSRSRATQDSGINYSFLVLVVGL